MALINDNFLVDLYINRKLSCSEIASLYGGNRKSYARRIKSMGKLRNTAEQQQIVMQKTIRKNHMTEEIKQRISCTLRHKYQMLRKQKISRDTLIDLYYEQKLTKQEICQRLNIGYVALSKVFNEYNIPKRTSWSQQHKSLFSKARKGKLKKALHLTKELLYQEYVINKSPIYQIATKYHISKATVSSRLKLFNIEKRRNIPPQHNGDSHPNWKGGITKENTRLRKLKIYKDWRQEVFMRDNFRCQHCGSKKHLTAHHIIPFALYVEGRYDVHNGITLCEYCHSNIDRHFYQFYHRKAS